MRRPRAERPPRALLRQVTSPVCSKQSLYYLGWFRICMFIIGPTILAICTTIAILGPYYTHLKYLERKQALEGLRVAPASSTTGDVQIIAPPPPPSSGAGQDV